MPTPDLSALVVAADRAALLGTVMRGLVHDFRNALQAVVTVQTVHESGVAPPERLGDMHARATERLTQLLTTLDHLFASDVAPAPVPLPDAVAFLREVEPYQRTLPEVTLEVDLPADLPPVNLSHLHLQHALLRLVTSAKQALEARPSPGGRVRLAARRYDGVVELAVEDEGPPLPGPGAERLFEPGHGAAPRTSLAAVRLLARGWGGDAWVEQRAAGVRVLVTMPAWAGR